MSRSAVYSKPIVKVPVAPELQKEIRKVLGPEMDHADLPHQILVLVRTGLRVKKLLAEQWQQEHPEPVPGPKCRILRFPRQE